ncbi:FAD-dependent monooxygenase [Comamonas sp. NLF-1-9]|uniref:FAD-dependent monooxygenase n=1 Tax=Comamonas sp. NLF-1-9 TaxID=2853163 RepID=UPI001C468002|nr:FAD-dependent monooxygenase [Comamonas sp. NLF-1-9]QXL85623.1 FAD-dependent monooxygenase [Comamonas sp. NLF-1-9]
MQQILIAGGGIAGLAAALASQRAGWQVRLHERAKAFGEIGAGVQLGPNAVRCLDAWGLAAPLRALACRPPLLQVRSALDGRELARMRLGREISERHGGDYLTIHRADLHGVLLSAVQGLAEVQLQLQHELLDFTADDAAVCTRLRCADGRELQVESDALLGADGLHSRVRALLPGVAGELPSGHLAYRAVVAQQALPAPLRSELVTVWLGPRLHLVHYPLRAGALLNLVAIRHGQPPPGLEGWDCAASESELLAALAGSCTPLQDLVRAAGQAGGVWRLWPLAERAPVAGAHEMAQGRVALAGDAAHAMRPYMAQGAGMAIEDAMQLQHALAMQALELPLRLRRYALARWQRVAAVQRRSRRNGQIFHAVGPLRLARDLSLRLLGERILDLPWLYRGGPVPKSE